MGIFRFPSVLSALVLAVLVAAAPAIQAAQGPNITRFEAGTVEDLSAGTELTFQVTGTQGARATVIVPGVKQPVRLRETAPGVYEGGYTIKKSDRPRPNAGARATLRKNNVETTVRLERSLASGTAAPAAAPAPVAARIDRFAMEPGAIEAGTELTFMLHGTPGAKVSVAIANTVRGIPMAEAQPGIYETRYTVRRQDRFSPSDITATLEAGGPPVRARLSQSAAAATPVTNVSPREGERVTQPFTISGTLANTVDPRSVRIFFSNNDVTRDATVTTNGFSYRPGAPVPPGRYRVDVSTRDNQGNAARTAWSFDVSAAPAAATGFPLEIISPPNQSEVGNAPVDVRGRTAPGATLEASVDSTATVFGPIGFSRNLMRQTVRADARGNFVFTFDPKGNPGGTRYEIVTEGTLNGEHKRAVLTLIQR